MFENINMKNSNARTFMMFYINDIMSFAKIFISKSLFKLKKFLKIENETLTKA